MADSTITPVSPCHAIHAWGGRVYARPVWMEATVDGETKFIPIADAVTVEHDQKDGSWTVRCVDGRWIRMSYTDDCRQAIIDATTSVKTDQHAFGPQLDLAMAPAAVSINVTCSEGVRNDGLSWMFDGDSKVGLHLYQWQQRFGESEGKLSDTQMPEGKEDEAIDTLTFDLEPHKAEVAALTARAENLYARRTAKRIATGRSWTADEIPPVESPIVDLDPSVHAQAANLIRWYLDGQPDQLGPNQQHFTWAEIHAAASDPGCKVTTEWLPGVGCRMWPLRIYSRHLGYGAVYGQIARFTATFDTSGIEGNVASCKLKLKVAGGTPVNVAIRAGITMDDTDNATFGNARSTGNDRGLADFNAATGVFTSQEMVGSGFAKAQEFALSVLEYDHDYLAIEPETPQSYPINCMVFETGQENGPYLEYTIASAASSRRGLMGVGT